MGKYGEASIKAVKYLISGIAKTPKDAWEMATIEIFGKGTTSQRKGCPRDAFLGLCEKGMIRGIPVGSYTRSKRNKEYAMKAIRILTEIPELSSNKNALWEKVVESESKCHNQQMDVVTSLWDNDSIKVSREGH